MKESVTFFSCNLPFLVTFYNFYVSQAASKSDSLLEDSFGLIRQWAFNFFKEISISIAQPVK